MCFVLQKPNKHRSKFILFKPSGHVVIPCLKAENDEIDTPFKTKHPENHTLSGGTSLLRSVKECPPPPGSLFKDATCIKGNQGQYSVSKQQRHKQGPAQLNSNRHSVRKTGTAQRGQTQRNKQKTDNQTSPLHLFQKMTVRFEVRQIRPRMKTRRQLS